MKCGRQPNWFRGNGMRFGLSCLLLGVCLLLSPLIHAQTSTERLSLAEYQTRLEEMRSRLADATDVTIVQAVQAELAAIAEVQIAKGKSVKLKPLLGANADEAPALEAAHNRVEVVVGQLGAAHKDRTEERMALLTAILQRREFRQQESLWARLLRWLRSLLPDELSTPTAAPTALSQTVGWGAAAIGAILVILLLSYWLQGLLGSFVTGREKERQGKNEAEPMTATAARQRAQTEANIGNFRAAVRQLYRSALLTLDERNLIQYDRSQTNREVLASIRQNQPLYHQLQPVVETFDDVWYGVHEPDRATFDRYAQAVKALEENK